MLPKPRTAVFKDSVTAKLALRAHFFIADESPKELLSLAKRFFIVSRFNIQQACSSESLLENVMRPANNC